MLYICFDEAFNEISKKGQMDIVIRFWDSSTNKVCSRYLSSSFMGHSTAENIMNNFLEASSGMNLCNLAQVSMYGPSVNWSFLEQLSVSVLVCNEFPKKFCSVRWLENVKVCERALEVFKHIKLYITFPKRKNYLTHL